MLLPGTPELRLQQLGLIRSCQHVQHLNDLRFHRPFFRKPELKLLLDGKVENHLGGEKSSTGFGN
jgi:hypothetical protein